MEVLVADDNIFARIDLSDRLRRRGLSVYKAGHAEQALKLMESHPSIGAIFSDLEMPGTMDGLALIHEVYHRWPGKRLVLFSGLNCPPAYEMPPNTQFLSKPVSRADLDRTLGRWLDFPQSA
jgi:CheY-like chemotaxis protein